MSENLAREEIEEWQREFFSLLRYDVPAYLICVADRTAEGEKAAEELACKLSQASECVVGFSVLKRLQPSDGEEQNEVTNAAKSSSVPNPITPKSATTTTTTTTSSSGPSSDPHQASSAAFTDSLQRCYLWNRANRTKSLVPSSTIEYTGKIWVSAFFFFLFFLLLLLLLLLLPPPLLSSTPTVLSFINSHCSDSQAI
jgi:hypothetical protein